jgi:hypothetical protein
VTNVTSLVVTRPEDDADFASRKVEVFSLDKVPI